MREESLLILTDFSTHWCLLNQPKAGFPFLLWEKEKKKKKEAQIILKAKSATGQGSMVLQARAP